MKLISVLSSIYFKYETEVVQALGCYRCTSVNGSEPLCEDPFFNNLKVSVYQDPCMAGLKGRDGLFPASACVKIKGTFGKFR